MNKPTPKGVPLKEYAKPIYEQWDLRGYPPPKGYACWMDYLNVGCKLKDINNGK